MKFLSVCSGIEAASCAWDWEAVAFSEIEKFPSQVLSHHYPETPNWGDMTKFKEWPDANVDVLVGGTPCQSFSVAGLRKGLDDPRGNLMLTYLAIAAKYRPKWVVWENVPGVLSSNGGLDFASFLRGLGECGYGFAYRVLDAQYFGVPQRRRRVFVVGCLGDWRSAAAVLFERHSLQGHPAPSREAGKGFASAAGTLTANGGGLNRPAGNANELDFCIPTTANRKSTVKTLMANAGAKQWLGNQEALTGDYHILEPIATQGNLIGKEAGNNGGENVLVQAVGTDLYNGNMTGDVAATMGTPGSSVNASGPTVMQSIAPTLTAANNPSRSPQSSEITNQIAAVYATSMAVRRLTPVECERLQGFPDGYTDIKPKGKPTPDGPRYKALGNSMAVPVMRWIGQRIEAVDRIK